LQTRAGAGVRPAGAVVADLDVELSRRAVRLMGRLVLPAGRCCPLDLDPRTAGAGMLGDVVSASQTVK